MQRNPLLLGACLLSSALFAQDFDPGQDWFVGTRPDDTAAADFNGDGVMDLATTVDAPDRVQFLLGDGNGGFVLGGTWVLPNSSSPGDLESGDFDGDGDMDLAVALKDSFAVQIGLNDGMGNFSNGASASVGDEARGMHAADHDGDGDLDLCVANRSSNSASVLTNNGSGSFASQTLSAGNDPRAAVFGDFDGDGDRDMAVSNHDDRTIGIYMNAGGSFAFSHTLSTGSQLRPEGLATGDLDGDGDEDLAAAANGNALEVAIVFTSTTAGSGFTSWGTGGSDTGSIAAGDFDCDGMIDLATVGQDSNSLSILPNLGGASYGAATILATGADPQNVDSADLDGDGDLDLFVPSQLENEVRTFENNCGGGLPTFTLTLSGTCPGTMTFSVDGATPNGRVALIYANGTGVVSIPNGFPCAGTVLGLDGSAALGATIDADASGAASFSVNVPSSFCGQTWVQALDLGSCSTSTVEGL